MNDKEIISMAMGSPTRFTMLFALLDGKALTAGELARRANISAQTASSHLHKLLSAGLITVVSQGRHRYYQLKDSEVAHVLETLSVLTMRVKAKKPEKNGLALHFARSCYDHLAGKLGVLLNQSLLDRQFLVLKNAEYVMTTAGEEYFQNLGVPIGSVLKRRRRFAYPCLDWSERVPHLAGALAAEMLALFLRKRWLSLGKQPRVLRLTPQGRNMLAELFQITLD